MAKGPPKRKPPGARSDAKGFAYWPHVLLAAVAIGAALALPYLSAAAPEQEVRPPKPAAGYRAAAARGGERGGEPVPEGSCERDASELCEPWQKAGYCHRPRRGGGGPAVADVRRQCKRTCGLCEAEGGYAGRGPPVDKADRCRRDNLTAAVPAGKLGALFEHIVASYPQYEPTPLSTSPWVLHLKNFISAEEAAAFQDVCKPSFERSLAGDQLNPVRTSFQCWCNFAECFTNPLVNAVTQRVNRVTGTSYDNGEDLQVVRYEPGQFYRRHHDQNTAVWTPQGPRVLTFFMYLNDPESGGETRFPSIPAPDGSAGGLTVSPKLGEAILWPSTLDDEPMAADSRTDHEAMPVHAGIKYGANMWIHQFSFKTPSERGCELTYVNTVGSKPNTKEQEAMVAGRVPTAMETVRAAGGTRL